jgi:tetratricopeptide (TPR) repeat protein
MNTIKNSILPSICYSFTILLFVSCSSVGNDEKFDSKIASAKKYLEEEKYQEARIELQTAIDLKPLEAEGYYQLAEVMLRLGDFSRALENYNSAINYNPDHLQARTHLASLQIIAKQFEYAESNLEEVLSRDPTNNDALVLKANMTFIGPRKNIDEARKILLGVLDRSPTFVPALGSLGHIELADQKMEKAEEYFLAAKKEEPKNQAIQVALTDMYARQGRIQETEDSLTGLVRDNPENTAFKYVLGEFFFKRGLNDNALQQYIAVLKNDPAVHDARDRLYEIYLARKQPEKAKALTREMEADAPNNEMLPYFKGRDEQLDGNFTKALEYFKKAISNSGTFAPAFKSAGILEITFGQIKEGVDHLEQALNIDPNNAEARYGLAKVKLSQNDIETAKLHVSHILERYPRHLAANVIRADIALIEDDLKSAEKVYTFLLENYPDLPVGHFKSGLLEEKRGNFAKAVEHYKKTLTFDIEAMNPGRRLALSMHRLGKSTQDIIAEFQQLKDKTERTKAEFDLLIGSLIASDTNIPDRMDKARSYFKSAIELNPNLISAYFALGGIDAVTGNLEAASENYKKLLAQNPTHIPTRMLLALTLEQKELYEESIEHYTKILEVNPRFGPAANNKAFLLVEEIKDGDLNEALRLAQIAKEELPNQPSVTDTLAWVHHKKGNHKAALTYLLEAYDASKQGEDQSPVNPEILYHLAAVNSSLGEKEEAKRFLEEALKAAGNNHPKIEQMKKLKTTLK